MRSRSLLLLLITLLVGCDNARPRATAETYQGTVEFEEQSLGFEVGGRLSALFKQQGDLVAQGEVLASLDSELATISRELRAAELKAAKARLSLLQTGARPEEVKALSAQLSAAKKTESLLASNLKRQKTLVSSGAAPANSTDELASSLSRAQGERKVLEERLLILRAGARPEELEAAQAQVEAASAALALEDARIGRYTLRTNLEGRVTKLHRHVNEVVAAGVPVLSVADTHHPYVDVFVPQGQMGGVVVGLPATLRVDALSTPLLGEVESIGHQVEFTPRFLFSERERPNLVLRVRVRIEDPGELLTAGLPAFVSFSPRGGAQ